MKDMKNKHARNEVVYNFVHFMIILLYVDADSRFLDVDGRMFTL